RRSPRTTESHTKPRSRPACARQCAGAPRLPRADTRPAGCRSTRAKTAGAPMLPGGRPRRIPALACSSFLLHCRGRARQVGRLLEYARVTINMGVKLHVGPFDGFRMTEKQVSPGLQVFIKTLDQLRLPLLREVNQNVHAENAVKLAHVHDLRQVHGREG